MSLILIILLILLLFGGGGAWMGRGANGAAWSANPISILLFVLMIVLVISVINHTAIGF